MLRCAVKIKRIVVMELAAVNDGIWVGIIGMLVLFIQITVQ